jgi:hypothetical protein
MSQTTSQPLVHQLLALSSHNIGVLISVASLPLKAVHSAKFLACSSWNLLTSSSQKVIFARSRMTSCATVQSNLSAISLPTLSIHCHTRLYPRFHGD